MISRETQIQKIQNQTLDFLVIGGGISGAGLFLESNLRGFNTILIEKNDFASGTSSKSGKLIHGGIRYLRYGHIGLVLEACKQRFYLYKKIAPHIVKPIRFHIPIFKSNKTKKWKYKIAMCMHDLLSFNKHTGSHKYINNKELENIISELKNENRDGAFSYFDCATLDFRLVIDTLKTGVQKGGHAFNYVEIKKIEKRENQYFVYALDKIKNKDFSFSVKTIINSTGAWVDDVISDYQFGEKLNLKITQGIHLVFSQNDLKIEHPVIVESIEDHRNIYCVPWGEYVICGTTDKFFVNKNKDKQCIEEQDIQYILNSLKHYFPAARLTKDLIVSAYTGIRPLIGSNKNKKEESLSREYEIKVHNKNLYSVTGGKLTTFLSMAQKTLNKACRIQKLKSKKTKLNDYVLVGADKDILKKMSKFPDLDQKLTDRIVSLFGSESEKIIHNIMKDQNLKNDFPDISINRAELDYILENEFTYNLSDILFRRTPFYLFELNKNKKSINLIAKYVGQKLKWSDIEIKNQIKDLENQIQELNQFIHKESVKESFVHETNVYS